MRWHPIGAAVVLSLVGTAAVAGVPTPSVEGPIFGVPFTIDTNFDAFDLAQIRYQENEFFLSGTASAYTATTPLDSDGFWSATPGDSAAYKTRVLVRRPVRRFNFNGTVVVEWFNVSGGVEAGVNWTMAHTEMIRQGFAWVGISAQAEGVEGGGPNPLGFDLSLKAVNPERYGSLDHPGSNFSYDIFSQAGAAVRSGALLGDFEVERLIGAGESQSAMRMAIYINAVHPLVGMFDGFMVHSRASDGFGIAQLSVPPQPDIPGPSPTFIRTDVGVPVLQFVTETDLTRLTFFDARQPDSEFIRTWEVAGTAHADTYSLITGANDLGDDPSVADLLVTADPIPGIISCDVPINAGPQHWVLKAAYAALDRWIERGDAPESAPSIEVVADPDIRILRDADGNALGGIRTPQVDVPIATLSGDNDEELAADFCFLFGSTAPFDAARLAELYPRRRDFRGPFRRAIRSAQHAKFIARRDARLMRKAVRVSDIGG